MLMQDYRGKALTVCGPVEPAALGRGMMHEHLHADMYDWERDCLVREERPIAEERRQFLLREVVEGLHGTVVHAGALKFGTSAPQMTPVEDKAARAVARAQKRTGVHITTHCTKIGAETTQLQLLADEGVDLNRAVIGHTAAHLMKCDYRKICIEWMRRGANFLPTNLGIADPAGVERWRPLVEAIHEVFDRGLGHHVVFGLDGAFTSENASFRYTVVPPPPFLHMSTHTLPAFRQLGLTAEEEDWIMRRNPQRIIPVQ